MDSRAHEQVRGFSWETPAARNGRGGGRPSDVPEVVEQLRQRPGEWARVTVVSHKSTARLRRQFPGTDWVSRDVRTDDPKLYGRWVGLDGEHA